MVTKGSLSLSIHKFRFVLVNSAQEYKKFLGMFLFLDLPPLETVQIGLVTSHMSHSSCKSAVKTTSLTNRSDGVLGFGGISCAVSH